MIGGKTISFVLGVKGDSTRVHRKNLRPFGASNLVGHKLDTLVNVKGVDAIHVHTESGEVRDFIKGRYGNMVKVVARLPYYASGECSGSEFFRNMAENTPADLLIYAPVTSPFVEAGTYASMLGRYGEDGTDSVVLVKDVKEFMWWNGMPVNYDPANAQNSQDLPEILAVTYGGCMLSRDLMIERGNVVGNRPLFIKTGEREAVDIDTPVDFRFAEFMLRDREDGLNFVS